MKLSENLHIAGQLARSTDIISKLRTQEPLDPKEQEWLAEIFNFNAPAPLDRKHNGTLIRLLVSNAIDDNDLEMFHTLLAYAEKIAGAPNNMLDVLDKEEKDFLLDALIFFRKHLLDIPRCDCY
jgi:hypothetical protein